MSQRAFLFDVNRCTGCQACEVACAIENELEDVSWRQVVTLNEARQPGVPTMHLSIACNHCEEPPCMSHCPALAYSKDPVTGRVDLDAEKCIGCGYCSWACPYDAPTFDQKAGVMTKCTFCGERQAAGLEPACVEQCPTGALGFGELADLPGVADGLGMPTLEPGPSIRFEPWHGSDAGPTSACADTTGRPKTAPLPSVTTPRKITVRSEWPLVVFTLIAALLVASQSASLLGAPGLPPVVFFALAALGMGASTAHLGKPQRAWRALLNVRQSWLSREIALFSGFMGAALLLQLGVSSQGLAIATTAIGLAAVFAIDRVYDVARSPESRWVHSADAVLTTGLLIAVLVRSDVGLMLVVLVKVSLYLCRKILHHRRGLDIRRRWSAARLGIGFFPAGLIAWMTPEEGSGSLLGLGLCVLVGELIDRCEFYEELEVPTPRGQMQQELSTRLASL